MIECFSGCSGTSWSDINDYLKCTDYALSVEISSGSFIAKRTVRRSTNMVIGYASGDWADEIRTGSGAGPGSWRIATLIDLTQKYPINSSPGTIIIV